MSNSPVSTKPDVSSADSPVERRVSESPVRRTDPPAQRTVSLPVEPSDRSVDADLLIDVPQLTVEELALELEASIVLNHVKLDAKGLDACLFLKANFDSLRALVLRGPESTEGPSRSPRSSDMPRVRSGLRELLGAPSDDDGDSERPNAVRERLRHAAGHGVKAAGLTAAGLAGGALLESRTKPSRKLQMPWRRSRAQAVLDQISRRLP
jgi:hypothetical protein